MRTSRKAFVRQMTQIERRQARIRRVRHYLSHNKSNSDLANRQLLPETTNIPAGDTDTRYQIGKTQNNPEHIVSFIQGNEKDPAIKVGLELNK